MDKEYVFEGKENAITTLHLRNGHVNGTISKKNIFGIVTKIL